MAEAAGDWARKQILEIWSHTRRREAWKELFSKLNRIRENDK
jgi:hypothetical protein